MQRTNSFSKHNLIFEQMKANLAKPECRVLHVFSVLGVGGAETWLMALLKYLKEAQNDLPISFKFDVCLTGGKKGHFDKEAMLLGSDLFYLNYTKKKLPSFARDFRKLLSTGKYHVVHDHQDYTAGIHFLCGLGCLPPIRIAHIHNPWIHIVNYASSSLRRFTIKTGKNLLSYLATDIAGTSLQMVGEYGFDEVAFNHVRLGVAHCGFDIGAYRGDHRQHHLALCKEFGWDEAVKIILFVGRHDSNPDPQLNQKNPLFALDIAKACMAKDSKVHMLMAGGGANGRAELEERVRSWGLSEKIRFIGVRDDIPRLMLGSNLLLLPSLAEGLGMVAVEAQAAGLRVLASDTTPRESVVVPDMIEFQSLDNNSERWANHALRLMSLARPDAIACNLAVKESPFSIENSAATLLKMYSRGCSTAHPIEL